MALIFTLVCVLILLFGAFVGFLRRPMHALVRLGTLIVSALLAFFGAKLLMATAGPQLVSSFSAQLTATPELAAYIEQNPAFMDMILLLLQLLVAPLAFLVFYILIKILMLIPYKIICVLLGKHRKGGCLGRLLGALVGVACGLVGVIVLITPICGYLNLMGTVMGTVMGEEGETPAELQEVLDLADAPLAGTLYDLVGDKLFEGLTKTTWEDEEISLTVEVDAMLSLLGHCKTLGAAPVAEYGEEQEQAVSAIADDIDSSYFLSHMGSGILASASQTWLNGGNFVGVERPAMGENVDGLLNGFLTVFSTSNADNIGADIDCFADIFTLLIEHDLFTLLGEGADMNGFVTKLVGEGIVNELYAILDAHPRMMPVKAAVADTGMRVMMQSLGLPEDLRESHGALLEDMSAVIKANSDEDGKVNTETLQAELKTTLATHNVEVSDEATKLIADGFADEFTAEEIATLSQEEMVDRLVNRFTGAK